MANEKRERQRQRAQARQASLRRAQKRRMIIKRVLTVLGVSMLVLLLILSFAYVGRDDNDTAQATTTTIGTPPLPCPAADGSSEKTTEFPAAPDNCLQPNNAYLALFTTDVGTFTVQMDLTNAPELSNNFVYLANYHYYDDTIFHRVIADFVVQGGDPTGTGSGNPGYSIPDEYLPPADATTGQSYKKYDVVMANSGPDTNGSQFFIVTGAQGEALPPQYSKFGSVVSGQEIVDQIAAGPFNDSAIPADQAHKLTSVKINALDLGTLTSSTIAN